MMADALGRPVTASTEQEPSSRGAALYALERIGAIPGSGRAAGIHAARCFPRARNAETAYARLLAEQHELYEKLFGH